MYRPLPYSHAAMAAAILISVLSVYRWRNPDPIVHFIVHDGLALVGIGIALYVVYWEPKPDEVWSRRLVLILAAILAGSMIGP